MARRKPRNQKYQPRMDGNKDPKSTNEGSSANYRKGNDICTNKFNDVSWYARNPQILKDAASLSFNNPVGGRTYGLWNKPTDRADQYDSFYLGSIPGVMQFGFVPGPGLSKDLTSAVNLAARDLYAFDRKANSGATNYNSPDLMIMLMAMDSIYMMYNLGKRAYGVMWNYEQRSRYMPEALCNACGFFFDDLQSNLATLRYWLNMFAGRINTIFTPATLPIVVRHSWMVSNVWKDSDTYKAQLYVFTPDVYYTLEEMKTPGMHLESHGLGALTVASYIQIMDQMISKVIESEDIGTISGDLIKAYGETAKFRITPLEENYVVQPVYNEEVLNQIHNLTTTGNVDPTTANVTYDPNTNCLLWNPHVSDMYWLRERRTVLNFPWDNVEPADVMVSSRLTCSIDAGNKQPDGLLTLSYCGTEFVTVWRIFQYGQNPGVGTTYQLHSVQGGQFINLNAIHSAGEYAFWIPGLMATQFDWHPLLYVFAPRVDESTSTTEYTNILGDFNNYTFIDDVVLDKLHTAAVLSEFGVPLNGAI